MNELGEPSQIINYGNEERRRYSAEQIHLILSKVLETGSTDDDVVYCIYSAYRHAKEFGSAMISWTAVKPYLPAEWTFLDGTHQSVSFDSGDQWPPPGETGRTLEGDTLHVNWIVPIEGTIKTVTCTCDVRVPAYGGTCRHCGQHDDYPKRGADGKVICWKCAG